MPGWDPFVVLWLPRDPHLPSRRVRRPYRAGVRRLAWIADADALRVQQRRLPVAYGALRTRARRRQVLTDLAVQPGWLSGFAHPDVQALADALLPPLPGSERNVEEALDARALGRTAAALRLERTATDVLAWPRTRLGRAWARVWYRWPGLSAVDQRRSDLCVRVGALG